MLVIRAFGIARTHTQHPGDGPVTTGEMNDNDDSSDSYLGGRMRGVTGECARVSGTRATSARWG